MFLHGYLSSKEAFTAQIAYFSKFYRVTALDFLGFGQSPPLTSPFSVQDYALWTEERLFELGVERPHVIAHSFGCRVALKMAEGRGQVFDKMVLTGPAGVILNRGFRYQMRVKTYRAVRKIAPKFAEKRFGSKEYRTLSPIMRESYKKIVNEDLRETASRVENPVLIIAGKKDVTTPLKESLAYLQVLKRGKLTEIDGTHFAFAENPLAFNFLAEDFFLHG